MFLAPTLNEPEIGTKLALQLTRRIAFHRKATAAGGPIVGEGGDEHDPAGAHRPLHLAHVPFAIGGTGEEVEHGTIVPHVDAMIRKDGREDVGHHPVHVVCSVAQASPGMVERGGRDVEDGDAVIAGGEEPVHEGG